MTCDIRQAKRPALVSVRQFLMVHAQQVQDRGVKIIHVHRVLRDGVAQIIGLTVVLPPLIPPPAIQAQKASL